MTRVFFPPMHLDYEIVLFFFCFIQITRDNCLQLVTR